MRVDIRTYLLATNATERATARAAFDEDEKEVNRLLDMYADKIVFSEQGRRLLSDYKTLSREWTAGARDIMALVDSGKHDEAANLLKSRASGLGEKLGRIASEWIQNNEELSAKAGKEAVTAIESSRTRMLVGNSAAIVIAALLGYITFRRIVRPLHGLEKSVRTIAAGNYKVEVPSTDATDETGALARSIDVLKQGAEAMDRQRWVKSSAAELTTELQAATSIAQFGDALLSGLVPHLGGGIAGCYIAQPDGKFLRRVAIYGLAASSENADVQIGHGLVGQCAKEKKPVFLSELPPAYFRISSGLGSAAPTHAAAYPVLLGKGVLGVIELAGFHALNSQQTALLEELLPTIALSLEVLQRNLRTQELLAQVSVSEERTRLILGFDR